jgi:hypothetical protein
LGEKGWRRRVGAGGLEEKGWMRRVGGEGLERERGLGSAFIVSRQHHGGGKNRRPFPFHYLLGNCQKFSFN